MAGGQQINAGQGTILGGPSQAVSGSEAASAAGTAPVAALVRLASRKVGGGTATFPLSGQASSAVAGTLLGGPGQILGGSVVSAAAGSLGRAVARLLSGGAVVPSIGTMNASGGAANNLTTFTLATPVAAGSSAFSLGVVLKKGAATSIATDLGTGYQVVVKRTWNDGSVKHAIVSGVASLTQNVTRTVNVQIGSAPAGTNLTSANIAAAAPAASVQCGALGTITLASLLATPFRTWISGPQMVECAYRADVGSTGIMVWFHVRLFANGSMRVRAVVEIPYFDNGSGAISGFTSQTFAPTVIIGGATVYATASLTTARKSRWTALGWIGGDPQVTTLHDVAYMRATKLVPNSTGTPSNADLNGLYQTAVPMEHGQITGSTGDMGDTGYQPQIGLVNRWDAMYFASGDARAFNACIAGATVANSYGIVNRDFTTKLCPRISQFATWTFLGPFGGGSPSAAQSGAWPYELSHHGSAGYAAYMLTGDLFFYETMLFNAFTTWACVTELAGDGANRFLRSQARGTGWSLRSVGQACALAPDADIGVGTIAGDFRNLLDYNYSVLLARYNANTSASKEWSGTLEVDEYYLNAAGTAYEFAGWMQDFIVQANGLNWDIEPLPDAQKYNLRCVRDIQYQWVVGRMGKTGDPDQYPFTHAVPYRFTAADTVTGGNWRQTWRAIYESTAAAINAANPGAWPTQNTVADNVLHDGNIDTYGGMQSYWGNLLPALSYAVEHKAAGALLAWSRLTGATNYASTIVAFSGQEPHFGVFPRVDTNKSVLQVAAESLSAGQSVKLSTPLIGSTLSADGDQFIQWGNSAIYDPTRREISYIGKRAGSFAYRRLTYDEATNVWRNTDPVWDPGAVPGHGYDHNAIDCITGDIYHHPYGATNVYKYSGQANAWAGLASWPSPAGNGVGGLTWFDNVGLIYNDGIAQKRWNGTSWANLSGFTTVDSYHEFSEYNYTTRKMFMGGGNASPYYQMNSALVVTAAATPPFTLGAADGSTAQGLAITDPSSGEIVLRDTHTGNWQAYSIRNNTYRPLTKAATAGTTTPQTGCPNMNVDLITPQSVIGVPIQAYGVIVFVQYKGVGSTLADVEVYKHSA